MNSKAFQSVHNHITQIMPLIKHDPEGYFKYPYLTVTYGHHYGGCIYGWDNHHMTLRFAAGGEYEQMRYFVDNMLSFQASSGYIPNVISAANGGNGLVTDFHVQPFLAQNAAIYSTSTNDVEWLKQVFPKLKSYLLYWLKNHAAPFGLCRWRYPYMSGFDNEITATVFPPDTIISPDLNAWLYLELRSMSALAEILHETAAQHDYLALAENMKLAINDKLWDEERGTYAAYDLCLGNTRVDLNSDDGKYAYLSCPAMIPLFARVAKPGQAARMIKNYVLNQDHFRSPYGIRSLSRSSNFYNNARWGNPPRFGDHRRLTNSNWQGPVWIPVNWFVFHALLHYGFETDAAKLAEDTFRVVSKNLDQLGFMRENFDAETGEALYADKFASWNILTDLMPDYLPGGRPQLKLFF